MTKRILSVPIMAVLILIPAFIVYFKWLKNWVLYGGEVIVYENKGERETIKKIYEHLKQKEL